jgi:ElaB/YqjD/DUF883 family membrane-anchored ribosome-binding protein
MTGFDPTEDRDPTSSHRATYVVQPGETARGVHGEGYQDAAGQDDPEQIKVDIEETRVELTATVDAIQERLNPSVLMDQAKEAVRDATVGKAEEMVSTASDRVSGVGSTIMETIRQNPVPAAMAGIGIGWLFMKRSRSPGDSHRFATNGGDYSWAGSRRGYGSRAASEGGLGRVQDRAGEVVGQVQDRVGEMADQIQSRASDMADQVTDRAGYIAEGAQIRARRVQGRIGDLLEENPLMAGALAVTVGAAIGLATPSTDQEHELFGESRDNLMRQVRGTARDVGQRVQRVAEQAQEAALKAADEQKLTT